MSWQNEQKKKGLCAKCLNPVEEGKVKCRTHLQADSQRKRKTYSRDKSKQKLIRQVHKEKGICIDCTEPVSKTNKSYCETHRIYHTAYLWGSSQRRWRNKQKRLKRCMHCTRPLAKGDANRCEVHIKYQSDWWMKGHGKAPWLRKPEVKVRKKKAIIQELKSSPIIKDQWNEIKDWVEANSELWNEKSDKALYNHMRYDEIEEFKDE